MNELNEYEHPEAPAFDPDRFTVDNDAKADWALRKLADIRAKQKERETIVAHEIERLTFWLAEHKRKFDVEAGYFESLLGGYAALERQKDRKTVDLPHGKIKSRAVKAKVEIANDAEFLAWARDAAPDLIRVKESPNIAGLNELINGNLVVSPDGEIIPAVTVIPPSVNFTIETE